jgi:PST family polysaccharide transporter
MDRPASDAAAEAGGEGRRPAGVLRNTGFGLLAQVSTAVFTAVLTLYLVRALSPADFGVFALALTIGGICLLFADAGLSQSAARFIAERIESPAAVTLLLADALRLKLMFGGSVALLLFGLAEPVAGAYDQPDLTIALRGIALAMFATSVMGLYLNAFIATARLRSNLRVIFLESVVEFTATITLVAAGMGVAGAAFGRSIGYGFGALVAMVLAYRTFGSGSLRIWGATSGRARELLKYAAPLFATTSAYTLYASIDVLLIGAYLNDVAVGLFAAPLRLMALLALVGVAVANAVAPRLALSESGYRDVATFRASLRWLMVFQAALLAPVIVWAEPIVVLALGADYRDSADVLRLLAPFVFLVGISPLISTGVNYLGRAGSRFPIVIGALLINAAIDVALIPQIGIEAGAIGTSVAYLVYVPGHVWLARQVVDLPLRPLAETFARCLAAAAAMAAVLLAVGTKELSIAGWAVGAVGGTAVFCATLLASREVSLSDVRQLATVVRARVRAMTGHGAER